jgi:acetyl-CoA acetyltransferase
VVTAGNSSQISDGAAALLVTTTRSPPGTAGGRSPGCTRSPPRASTRSRC